jgi:hypothetical protein
VRGANLEDVFMQMTGRKLSDDERETADMPAEPVKKRRRASRRGGTP